MLRVLKNRVLRRIFGPERSEVREKWSKLKSLIVCTPHQILLGGKIEKNETNGACNTYGLRRGAHRLWVGKPEGKRPLGRRGRRWEDNIKMHREVVRWGYGLDSSGSG